MHVVALWYYSVVLKVCVGVFVLFVYSVRFLDNLYETVEFWCSSGVLNVFAGVFVL